MSAAMVTVGLMWESRFPIRNMPDQIPTPVLRLLQRDASHGSSGITYYGCPYPRTASSQSPGGIGECDAARYRTAIDELYTHDYVLQVPPGTFVGCEASTKFAGGLCTTHSYFVYIAHGEPQALHGRLARGSGPRGEAPDYTGLDVIIIRDSKIAALHVFLDSVPS
jgi:hypothetical protein